MTPRLTLPAALAQRLQAAQREMADAWWADLDEVSRRAISALCDDRLDDITITRHGDEWCGLTIELRGRFVDPEDVRDDEMWCEDLIEYINNRPEMRFHLEERELHICRAHPIAREVVRAGLVPSAFVCPAGSAACPFETASELGGHRPLLLTARLSVVRPCSYERP